MDTLRTSNRDEFMNNKGKILLRMRYSGLYEANSFSLFFSASYKRREPRAVTATVAIGNNLYELRWFIVVLEMVAKCRHVAHLQRQNIARLLTFRMASL